MVLNEMPAKLATDLVVAVTLEAATKLTAHFSLPMVPNHVDWDILCTFGDRTEEFLTHYETCMSTRKTTSSRS